MRFLYLGVKYGFYTCGLAEVLSFRVRRGIYTQGLGESLYLGFNKDSIPEV